MEISKHIEGSCELNLFMNVINTEELHIQYRANDQLLVKSIFDNNVGRITDRWKNNTKNVPDFVTVDGKIMIEMYEVDDIVTKKKGKDNPARKLDAKINRDIIDHFGSQYWTNCDSVFISGGNTRNHNYTSKSKYGSIVQQDQSYSAYIDNISRITNKHLQSIPHYKNNYPDASLGFLLLDDSSIYVSISDDPYDKDLILSYYPFYDKNIMDMFIGSDVDFIVWAFNGKYYSHKDDAYDPDRYVFPLIWVISKDQFINENTKRFDKSKMILI